jgi:tetraacyldisaccharide 4'-kinase
VRAVPLDEPSWWYGTGTGRQRLAERLLAPVGDVYGHIVERRFNAVQPYRSEIPVICVGNFTAGGTGKTPLTRFLVDLLAGQNVAPVCLTRGYGGSLSGPVWVDTSRHSAKDVGDEPLLVAKTTRVVVSRDRKAGLQAIADDGTAQAVIMDDGLQNPSLAKDMSIAVVDAGRGLGNGRVIPAGPLRARLEFQLGLVDCIVVMGADPPSGGSPVFEGLKRRFHGPVLRGAVSPAADVAWISGSRVLAFAGIANPGRFFRLVESLGPSALTERAYSDHHVFTQAEAAQLLAEADRTGAILVTTEKDLARLAGTKGAIGRLAALSKALPIEVRFEDRDLVRLRALIDGVIKAAPKG